MRTRLPRGAAPRARATRSAVPRAARTECDARLSWRLRMVPQTSHPHGTPRADAKAPSLRLEPRRYSRARLAAFHALETLGAWLGGRALYRRAFLAAGRLRVRQERVLVPRLAHGLRGLRIVQWSDLHAGPFLGRGDLRAAVDATLALQPDLVVFTGDWITREWSEALALREDLARLRARLGLYAVFGNHDYRGRCEGELARAFAPLGIEFLRNEARRFECAGGALCLVGLEDLEESRELDLAAARAPLREGDVELVLCHNPRGAPLLARAGCAAILSGHTHGHQVDLPLVRRLAPAHPGDRVRVGASELIVSRGLGALGVPLRVRSPAEIVCIELADSDSGSGAP